MHCDGLLNDYFLLLLSMADLAAITLKCLVSQQMAGPFKDRHYHSQILSILLFFVYLSYTETMYSNIGFVNLVIQPPHVCTSHSTWYVSVCICD